MTLPAAPPALPPLPPLPDFAKLSRPVPGRPDTRMRLLDAALGLVQTQGIQALTQARVAAAAGLRQSHLTYHFPTRAHLLTAVALHCAASTLQLIWERPGSTPTLTQFREELAEHVSCTPMPRLLVALTVASEEDHRLKTWMAEFETQTVTHLQARFRSLGIHAGRTAIALFHASVVGIATLQVAADTPAQSRHSRALVQAAFDRLLADPEVAVRAGECHAS